MAKKSLQVNVDEETFAGIEAEQRRLSALVGTQVSQSLAIASLLKRGLSTPPAVTPAPPAVAPVAAVTAKRPKNR